MLRMNIFSPQSSKSLRGEKSSAFSSLITPPVFLSLPPPFLAHGRRASSSSAVLSLFYTRCGLVIFPPVFAAFPVPHLPRESEGEGAPLARGALYPDISFEEVGDFFA